MLTLEKLQEIVVTTGIELKDHAIAPEKSFQENGIDSLDTMTLLLNIEEATGLKFTEEEVESIKTFNDIIEIAGKR
jgi:acyl carrier protein